MSRHPSASLGCNQHLPIQGFFLRDGSSYSASVLPAIRLASSAESRRDRQADVVAVGASYAARASAVHTVSAAVPVPGLTKLVHREPTVPPFPIREVILHVNHRGRLEILFHQYASQILSPCRVESQWYGMS